MTDRNNLDVVRTELVQLDRLCQQFHDAYKLYYDVLIHWKKGKTHLVISTARKVASSSTARKSLIRFWSVKQRLAIN